VFQLARKISVKELPHLVLLLDGKVIHYKDPQFSAVKILEFVRRKFPWRMVESVDDTNIDTFLNGWNLDNRVRVLLFGKTDVIRLRYLTTAFKYRNRALIGYVKLQGPNTDKVVDRFKVPTTGVDTLLIFQENVDVPVASVSTKDISLATLFEMVEANQFLQLPRLSSQDIFDQLCPGLITIFY
jgi:DnaJ family protein C protein 16